MLREINVARHILLPLLALLLMWWAVTAQYHEAFELWGSGMRLGAIGIALVILALGPFTHSDYRLWVLWPGIAIIVVGVLMLAIAYQSMLTCLGC